MRDALAERLLANVMNWSPADVARERPILSDIALLKYDEYKQFSPGMRFVESLAIWLTQFETANERKIVYNFIRARLIYISQAQMSHFVSIVYPDYIRPLIFKEVAEKLHVDVNCVKIISNSKEFRLLRRQCLFLGLSDGAQIDYFRRSNPELSHEQIFLTYDISTTKKVDMLDKLLKNLKEILDRDPLEDELKFKFLFLLDDFTGSGKSYFRTVNNGANFSGKIYKVLKSIIDPNEPISDLVDIQNLKITIALFVATNHALTRLNKDIKEWISKNSCNIECNIIGIQKLPESIKVDQDSDREMIDILKKYFDKSIIDEHYKVGNCDNPYMGFDECSLPLILSHNTPNNSLPLLWFDESLKYRGLFPRVRRHKLEV